MTMALPARRAAVGMVAVAVPAVRTRPPGIEPCIRLAKISVHVCLIYVNHNVCICICCLPAAVNATLTGSTMGAGAPETERRQHARARTTKPFRIQG